MQKLAIGKSILEHILERVQSFHGPDRELVCVFDLDSTLYDLTDRKQQILLSYLSKPEYQSKFATECAQLANVQVYKNEFGINEALARVGLSQKTHPDFYKDVYTYWEYYFFHNDFVKFDRTLPGAVDYVRKVASLGAYIIYLTGRDEPRMLKGTLESLESSGFPLNNKNIEVCLKPHSSVSDHQFKLDFMKELSQKFKEVWLFENEPVNINLIEKHCPATNFVFIDTNHSGIEEVGNHHFSIKDFR